MMSVELMVNGEPRSAVVEPRRMLVELLREDFGLTGTHVGCEHGVCGACTVLIDGEPARSCLTFAVQVSGASITTVEGLGTRTAMHPVQQACYEAMSFQCGFCTPGMLITMLSFLTERADAAPAAAAEASVPSEQEIRAALGGNLCRCTGYQSIVDGVRRAAELLAADAS
jgi:carbon-monoxide dehydrogenase small subunit